MANYGYHKSLCSRFITDLISDDLQTGIRLSPSKRREEKTPGTALISTVCNVPDDISTPPALILSKLSGHRLQKTEEEINASCSAFLFVLTCY
ncbi:hypothetical protein JOB18_045285 [Solea senegalensis]|uniref:Uncharacterized protein n=1 Tax=Solea senegalensis TaxID=28829 RepID=A0AAV6SP55_SOLSE|nr:hypothetical protein JOB18_045285 [Solea senegalensis]